MSSSVMRYDIHPVIARPISCRYVGSTNPLPAPSNATYYVVVILLLSTAMRYRADKYLILIAMDGHIISLLEDERGRQSMEVSRP